MRNFLCLAAAFALSIAVLVPTPTADACGGGYDFMERAPRAHAVTTHSVPRAQGADRLRAFVALGGSAPTDAKWTVLSPMSYDRTQIAPAPQGAAMTVTLVGERGTRVITSARYVWLKESMFLPGSTLALEVDVHPNEEREIALLGTHRDAKWSELSTRGSSKVDADWMRAQGIRLANDNAVSAYRAGDVELLSAHDEKLGKTTTVLRKNHRESGRHFGWPRGLVDVAGKRYVAMAFERHVSLIAL